MNLDDDEDSVFEQALRADLPSKSQQNRMRQRVLAAGLAAGTALGSTNVAAASQASFGASALSKLSALSWPAKLGLAAALAAPAAALPLSYTPVRGAALVRQVQSSAAAVQARSAAKLLSRARALPPAPQTAEATATPLTAPAQPDAPPQAVGLSRAIPASSIQSSAPAAPPVASAANDPADSSGSAIAAFDSVAHDTPASESPVGRNPSTLAAETQLLDRAFAALAAGDRRTASSLVAEHARLFPNGLLRQERERARQRLASDPQGE